MIDTHVFMDAENGRLDLNGLDSLSDHGDAYIAAITVSELLIGVHLAKTTENRIQRSAFTEGLQIRGPSRSPVVLWDAPFQAPVEPLGPTVLEARVAGLGSVWGRTIAVHPDPTDP